MTSEYFEIPALTNLLLVTSKTEEKKQRVFDEKEKDESVESKISAYNYFKTYYDAGIVYSNMTATEWIEIAS